MKLKHTSKSTCFYTSTDLFTLLTASYSRDTEYNKTGERTLAFFNLVHVLSPLLISIGILFPDA